MSVNIFGSSGTFSHDVNSHYADQKFTTLSSNLTSKVNKSGDTVSGDLTLLVNDDSIRTFGVSDLSSGKSMSLLLGDQNNQIRHNYGNPLKIAAANGTKFTCPQGDICRMGAENDIRAHFFQDIIMNNKYIARLRDPSSAQDALTKNYTDNNDNLRVLKTGDIMTGSLYIDGTTRNVEFGCRNLGTEHYFRIYLGSEACKINTSNNEVNIFAANSLNFSVGTDLNSISINPSEIVFTNPLSMTNSKITNLSTPSDPTDAATKQYVDARCMKNNIGYIPNLEANISLTGFVATSSQHSGPSFQAYGAFNNLKADSSWNTTNPTGWLMIQCPTPVKIWKLALKARSFLGKKITSWTISANNGGAVFDTLLTSTTTLFGAATAPSFFEIDTPTAYQYYKFSILSSEGAPGIGVQYMQLYIVDTIV